MPEIIDGTTYKTTPGGRPYPESTSPGKALWQLLERAMRELDDFETYELAAMTAAITALDAKVSAAGGVVRRHLTKTTAQNIANATVTVLTWDSDAARGDVVPSASDTTAIKVASTGVITLQTAGLYQVTAVMPVAFTAASLSLRRTRGGTTTIVAKDGNTNEKAVDMFGQFEALAGDTLEVLIYVNGSGGLITGSDAANNTAPSNAVRCTVVRLGS